MGAKINKVEFVNFFKNFLGFEHFIQDVSLKSDVSVTSL